MRRLSSDNARFWLIFGVHLAVALAYKQIAGVDIQADPVRNTWDWFWQTLPLDALRFNLGESLWHLHSQPPLFNLYGAFFARLCYPAHLQAMQYANMLLGAALSAMLYPILRQATRTRNLAWLAALAIALNPALFLYEAYILYDLLTAFLVTLCVYCVARAGPVKMWRKPAACVTEQRNRGPLWASCAFILAVNLLTLTRSSYHLALLLVAVPFSCFLARSRWRQALAISLVISSLSVGWYAKNAAQFGFFGGSSWYGLNLWHMVADGYDEPALRSLTASGLLDRMVVETPAFAEPSRYVAYGFDRVSDSPVLNRDDYNNINIPAVSAVYARNALRLIVYDPGHYVGSVLQPLDAPCDAAREKIPQQHWRCPWQTPAAPPPAASHVRWQTSSAR